MTMNAYSMVVMFVILQVSVLAAAAPARSWAPTSRQVAFAPPASPSSSPGLDFSLLIPGYTINSFWTAQKTALCDAITTGWTSFTSGANCTVASVTNTTAFNVPGPLVMVNGYAFFTWKSTPTTADLQAAASIRDSRTVALTKDTSSVLGSLFPGAVPNCACYGTSTVTTASNSGGFSYNVKFTGVPGFQCGAKLTYDGSLNGQVNQVGVDNGSANPNNFGKYCSTPAVNGGVLGIPGSGSCFQYGVVSFAAGGTQATATATVANGSVSSITIVAGGSGYSTAPVVNVSAPNPTPATVFYSLNSFSQPISAVIAPVMNGPYNSAPAVASLSSNCIDTSNFGAGGADKCSGAPNTFSINGVVRTGALCLAADLSPATLTGTSVSGGLAFPNSANSVYCTQAPTATLSTDNLQPAVSAFLVSTVASGVVTAITIVSAGSGYSTPPVVTIAFPANGDIGKLCSIAPINNLPASIAYPTVVASISTSSACTPLGRETYLNVPCSLPAAPGGVANTLNAGACNVVSSFISLPGPTAANTCGIVPQSFDASAILDPTPTPAPAPAPCSCPAGPAGPTGPAGLTGPQGAAGFGSTCSATPSTTGVVTGTVSLPIKSTFIRRVSSKASCPAGKILTSYDISFGTAAEADAARISVYPTNLQNGYKVGTTITPGSVSFVASIGSNALSKAVTITITPTCCTPV